MRLVLATDVTVRGGVDNYVLDLANVLNSHGHSVIVLLEESTTSALYVEAPARGFDVRTAALYHRRHTPVEIAAASAAALDELRPEGVHVVCGSPRSCLGLRAAAGDRGVPMVITEQQVDASFAPTNEVLGGIRASYRAARMVVFVSEGNRDIMRRVVGLDGVRHQVIPNGVDVARLRATARGLTRRTTDGPARVMTAARLAPEKALDLLVEAMAILPTPLVRSLDIYGEGPEDERLARLIDSLGLRSRVSVHPWSPRIVEEMVVHDLFVLPSHAEGMPMALLEAMAIGLPVVATDVAGISEVLSKGITGWLVRPGDAQALADGIRRALCERTEATRRCRAAAERTRLHHDLGPLMRKTAAIWADGEPNG